MGGGGGGGGVNAEPRRKNNFSEFDPDPILEKKKLDPKPVVSSIFIYNFFFVC